MPAGETATITPTKAQPGATPHGLSSDVAAGLLQKDGRNAMPDTSENLLKNA
jgi:hypothetical protein